MNTTNVSRLGLGQTVFNPDTFKPVKYVFVDGIKTQCKVDIESIQDAVAVYGNNCIKSELTASIFEELKSYNITTEEVAILLHNSGMKHIKSD